MELFSQLMTGTKAETCSKRNLFINKQSAYFYNSRMTHTKITRMTDLSVLCGLLWSSRILRAVTWHQNQWHNWCMKSWGGVRKICILTEYLFQPASLIAYLQTCTALLAVAAVSQDVTFGLSIGTDIWEEPNASSSVIVPMGLKGFFRNVGACLSGYTAAHPRRP